MVPPPVGVGTTLLPRTAQASAAPDSAARLKLRAGNLAVAEGLARELGPISLADAFELTALVARKGQRRHPRVAARWLQRYLEEYDAMLGEITLVVGALSALSGERHAEALRVLRAMVDSF